MLKKIVIAAALLAAMGSSVGHAAGTSSVLVPATGGTLNVTAQVSTSCVVSLISPVAFGLVGTVAGATSAGGSNGQFSVACDAGTDYAVGIGAGSNFLGTRQMVAHFGGTVGDKFLPYELYTEATFLNVFKDVLLGQTVGPVPAAGTVGKTSTGALDTFNVYGRIPLGTLKPLPGNYADAVTVNLIY